MSCDIRTLPGPLGIHRPVCVTHDLEVDQRLVDAYISKPTPGDYICPNQETQ